jgi:hypothetical protein
MKCSFSFPFSHNNIANKNIVCLQIDIDIAIMPKAVAGAPSGRKARGKSTSDSISDKAATSNSSGDTPSNENDIDKALSSLQDQLQRVDELCIPSETKAKVRFFN